MNPNYISISDPYHTWKNYIVIDLDTGEPVPFCQEVNVSEGWIMQGRRESPLKRVDGHYRIESCQ